MTNGNLIGIVVDLLHVPRLAVELWVGEILTPAEAKKLASGKRDHDENFVVAFVVAMERESEGKSVMNQKT